LSFLTNGGWFAIPAVIDFTYNLKLMTAFCKNFRENLTQAIKPCVFRINKFQEQLKALPYQIISFQVEDVKKRI
jgi:hypothetical protein